MLAGNPVSPQDLIACLETLTPVKLIGLALLEECQPAPGGLFPGDVPLDQLVAATVQLIQYGDACRQVAGKLAALHAIPVSLPIVEYGL